MSARRLLLSLMGLVALAVASLSLPAAPAHAAIVTLELEMDGPSAILTCPGGSGGTGEALSLTYDTGSNLLSWNITFQGLSGLVTVAHFHGKATPAMNAGIQVIITDIDSPSIGSATITEQQESELLQDLWYVNYHTAMCPAGEIRGQVIVPDVGGIVAARDTSAAPIEAAESDSNAGLLAGVASAAAAGSVALGGVVWYAWRRRAAE